ncbi:putative metal-dependent hydrolase of the TIM-barrel fold protein [Luteitalea pratensis]|uniref:Putative metal-dependent hydrolase of the TIM-barrel fold protein n=1 Tax=Luteitalea pratensis TaxID=1855912 RepID=A0A143PEC0_LUTPR|nr:amidohydrolase family protein [Luteitalea pratensis]AMY06865.1 putative metal-dependent hydrolase of the TIM-barrel fold protein [Luteitalea pratensis]
MHTFSIRAALAAAVIAIAVTSSIGPLTAKQAPPARFVIDSHQHWRSAPDYIPTLVKTYRARNAMACVLTPIDSLGALMAAAKQYPDVIIPYGYLDVDHPDARAQLETFAKAGVKGIKMHRPKLNWDDFGYFPLYGRMQELGLVALFHTGIVAGNGTGEPEQSSMARMRPSFLHTLARSFPALKIQGAHLGNPWYDEAAEAARWSPNLYFDVTGSTLLKKQHNLKVFREYLWWDGPSTHTPSTAVYAFEKIVFGTDEPPDALDGVLARYEAMLDANDVPEASRRKIYGETMARLLGITPRP